MGLSDRAVRYDELAVNAYLTANTTPEAITTIRECFRAGYQIDRGHDMEDRMRGKKIKCP